MIQLSRPEILATMSCDYLLLSLTDGEDEMLKPMQS
jgi:hypothetical protein